MPQAEPTTQTVITMAPMYACYVRSIRRGLKDLGGTWDAASRCWLIPAERADEAKEHICDAEGPMGYTILLDDLDAIEEPRLVDQLRAIDLTTRDGRFVIAQLRTHNDWFCWQDEG